MLRKLLPHIVIIISGMYFVFFFIDRVNSAMAFIDNDITKGLLFLLCVVSVINALIIMADNRRRYRDARRRSEERRAETARRRSVQSYVRR